MMTDTIDRPARLIRAENFPSKERMKHDRVDIIQIVGPDKETTPTAKVRYTHCFDLLEDMGVIDNFQVGYVAYFAVCRDAAQRRARGVFDTLLNDSGNSESDTIGQADMYYKLIGVLPKPAFKTVRMVSAPIGQDEDIDTLRRYLFALGGEIIHAMILLEKHIDEIRACNQ